MKTGRSIDFKKLIQDVPDFPKKGIIYKDITPVLTDPIAMRQALHALAEPVVNQKVSHIVCIEARGFIFGSALAHMLSSALVPVRKKGKLPRETFHVEYALEYGTDALELHRDAIQPGSRVLVVDDVLATGGTMGAVRKLLENFDATLLGFSFFIELGFLHGRKKLGSNSVHSVVTY